MDLLTLSNEIKGYQEDIKKHWSDVEKLHEDLKAEKSTRDADLDTFKQADALRKEQLETMTAKMNDLELKIARHKGAIEATKQTDERTEKLWEVYAEHQKTTVDKLDRKAIKEAVSIYAKHGKNGLTPEHLKLLSTQDNANGGYLITPEIDSQVDKILADISGVRSVADVRQVSSSVFEIVQRRSRPTVSVPGEGGTTSRSNSTFGKVSVPNRRYTSRVGATIEEVQDSLWSIEMLTREDVAEEMNEEQGADFVAGTGVNEPEGLWTNADIVSVASGAATAVTYAGLIKVSHGDTTNGGFNRNYHANARFALNLVTLGSIRLLEDGASHLIFQPGVGDISSTIAGFPYVIFPDAPSEAANAFPVMFGDFRKGYVIVDRVGTTMLVDPFSSASEGIIEYHFGRRTGGKVKNASVLRKLKCAA